LYRSTKLADHWIYDFVPAAAIAIACILDHIVVVTVIRCDLLNTSITLLDLLPY